MNTLSQDTLVVNSLKCILDDYDYLEYNESKSRNEDFLHVDVTCYNTERPKSLMNDISTSLEHATGKRFRNYAIECGHILPHSNWRWFRIRKNKLP